MVLRKNPMASHRLDVHQQEANNKLMFINHEQGLPLGFTNKHSETAKRNEELNLIQFRSSGPSGQQEGDTSECLIPRLNLW